MKLWSLICFELFFVSCIRLVFTIIMIHDNSMHTLHTIPSWIATSIFAKFPQKTNGKGYNQKIMPKILIFHLI